MNNEATGEVDDSELSEPPVGAPNAEGGDGVGESEPEWHEEHPCSNVHPAKQGPRDQNQGNSGEHALKEDHRSRGEGPEKGLPQQELVVQCDGGLAEEEEEFVAEGHVEGPADPAEEDGGEGVEGHEGRVESPGFLDQASVQDDQAWNALEPHHCGRR